MAVKKINFGGAFFVTGAFMCAAGTPNLSDAAVQARNLQASEIIGVISILCGIILIVGSFLFEKRYMNLTVSCTGVLEQVILSFWQVDLRKARRPLWFRWQEKQRPPVSQH